MPTFKRFPHGALRLPNLLMPLVAASLGLLLIAGASAQVPTQAEIDNARRAGEQIQREQQERQQRQLREDGLRRRQAPPQDVPQVKVPSLPKSAVCRDIREIVLTGATLLSPRAKQDLVAPYAGKCLYAEDIEKLLADVLKAYIDLGYIAARPYVQAQDLGGGRLDILIVEGKAERLILKDGGKNSVSLGTAFPFVTGQALNLRDIEQGLDQINRLASNNANMEIGAGAEPGASIVTITNTPSFPISASASLNNLGGIGTGENQGSYTVSLDNPLRLNDFITYTHSQTVLERNPLRDSAADSFFYSLPLGYWTLQLSSSSSSYRTPVTASVRTLVARGDSDTFRTELNKVAYRDRDQKLTALVAITRKSSKNYLDNEFLAVSSRKLTILDLGANWTRRFRGLTANLSLGWSKGEPWFNALEDPAGIDPAAPHAQGAKLTYSGGVQLPFAALDREFSFSSQLTGQHALQPLHGSEQITIGSHYRVRGFNRNSLPGDRGWFVRNEVSTALPKLPFADITPRPYLALDAGRIEGFQSTAAAGLSGAAAGIRFAGKHLAAEISVAKSISVPGTIAREPALYAVTITASF